MKKIILPAKVFEFSLFDFIRRLGDAGDADRMMKSKIDLGLIRENRIGGTFE